MGKPVGGIALAGGLAVLTVGGPAAADGPGESDESAQLVREAIALIVNTPGDMEGIEDKIVDAQEAPTQEGVDLALVAEAEEAFERAAMHEVRALLARSLAPRPHRGAPDPLPLGVPGSSPGVTVATGAENGHGVAIGDADTNRNAVHQG